MRVAVLIAELFDEAELLVPYYRLLEAGHEAVLVGARVEEYRGKHGYPKRAEQDAAGVDPAGFNGVVIPGGFAPEYLRRDPHIVTLVRRLAEAGKPVAAICHGPWLLVTAGVLAGRRATSYPSLRPEVEYAGANWVDEEVVVDGPLITSRTPADLPAFLRALLAALEA
jgi:protease I